MIGQRGIPATFGGIEHHVEELGSRLADRGHQVTVYTRTSYSGQQRGTYRGMTPRYVPTLKTKHLDAIVHSTLSTLDAMVAKPDIVHYHAVGPGIPAVLPRFLSDAKVVLTVHGLDAERAKWGGPARTVLRGATWLSARVPHATIVVSRTLERHFQERYRRRAWYVPNGVNEPRLRPPGEILRRWDLRGNDYALFVGRLVPEKAPDLLVRAFRGLEGDVRLVVAGGSSFTDTYVRELRALAAADRRVILAGSVYGEVLEELYSNAAVFALPSLLEGLPLTLLEAASYGIPLVVSDIGPNLEIVGSDAPGRRVVKKGDVVGLTRTLAKTLEDQVRERRGADAFARTIVDTYRWNTVATSTESLYRTLMI